MNSPIELNGIVNGAAERSAVYRALAQTFTYAGAQQGPFEISGFDFNEAFDPSVSATAASLREGSYADEDQSALFEELVRFYQFFGLNRGEGAEMPDHISVELEFMHFLTHLESVTEDPEALGSLYRAQLDFLQRHLRRVALGAQKGMKSTQPQCVELMETCVEFIEAELALIKEKANG